MTSATSTRLGVALAGTVALLGCTDSQDLYDPLPPERQGVRGDLAHRTDLAPIRGVLLRANGECRVPNWLKLHPDRPDRIWGELRAFDFRPTFVDPSLGFSEGNLVFASGTTPISTSRAADPDLEIVALATRWGGDAPIECGGIPAAGGIVVRWPLMGQDMIERDGLTRDDVVRIASENVARDGLVAVDDYDLSVENLCVTRPEPDMPCVTSEPPEP